MNTAYKKKSLKFSNEQYSRDVRHAEALKARESSRFKRLSMIRDIINDSDLTEEKTMESVKSVSDQKVEKPPLSRLDRLYKWKQEKLLKKEYEKKNEKPFYNISMQSTLSNTINVSRIVKSKLLPPQTSFQPRKTPNVSKQLTSSASIQSKIPSNCKQLNSGTSIQSKIPSHSKQLTSSTSIQSRIPSNSKQACSMKNSNSFLNKGNNTSTFPKKLTKSSSISRFTNKSEKATVVKQTPDSMQVKKTSDSSLKALNKGSSAPKLTFSRLPSKSVQKIPVPSTNEKSAAPPKLNQKGILPSTENAVQRKGYCFKKAFADANKQQAESKKNMLCSNSKKVKVNAEKDIKRMDPLPQQNSLNNPDITLNCNVSIIPPADSFAPAGFKFQPPAELANFIFEEEDPYEVLEEIFERKYMARTSTPSKESDKDTTSKYIEDYDETTEIKNSSETSFNKSPEKNLQMVENVNVSAIQETHEEIACNIAPKTKNECYDLLEVEDIQKELIDNSDKSGISKCNVKESLKIDNFDNELIQNTSQEHLSNNTSPLHTVDLSGITPKCDKLLGISVIEEELGDSDKDEIRDYTETQKVDNWKSEPLHNESEEHSACCESPFDIIDLSDIKEIFEKQTELTKLEDKRLSKMDILEERGITKFERIPVNSTHKRVSMLKSVSTLNAISESSEADECSNQSSEHLEENHDIVITPRRSKRLSCQHLETRYEPVQEDKLNPLVSFTPRRSLRLQKAVVTKSELEDELILSPFEIKKSRSKVRRSMKLIDLNTPERDSTQQVCSKTDLTADFGKLNLKDSENVDPNSFLIDFESSPGVQGLKSRKVSLLYTPEKRRKSLRKSIRGDLMAFSPSN